MTQIANYTPEQVTQIVTGYQAGETLEALAAAVGKSVKSVVAKLAREGVYQPKSKPVTSRVTKADLISILANRCGVDATVLASLEKASVDALQVLVNDKAV